jgi:hypothetical protein
MWGHSGRIQLTDITKTHLRYTIDTCPGHSGSPIWLLGNNNIRLLLGVHTTGPVGCDNDPAPGAQCRRTEAPVTPVAGKNCGVRITCDVINNILKWCKEFGVRGPVIDQVVYRRQCTNDQEIMDGLIDESLNEIEEVTTPQWYYYWEVHHKPAYQWLLKQQTKPELLTSFSASNKHIQYWNSWSKSLGLSGGWLYIARYYWNGNWYRDRCDMRDLTTMKFYSCS